MKLFKVLILIAAVCASSASTEDLKETPEASNVSDIIRYLLEQLIELGTQAANKQIIKFIESQRPYFATGWPLLGIPPLDPYAIKDFNTHIDALGSFGSFDFSLSNAHLVGLQQFQIRHFYVNFLKTSVDFTIFFERLVIDGHHDTTAKFSGLPVKGSGDIEIILHNVEVSGSIALSIINGGYLNIDRFELHESVGSVKAHLKGFGLLDKTVSDAVTLALDGLINESLETLNVMISEVFVPTANAILNSLNLVDILLALIGAITNPNLIELSEA